MSSMVIVGALKHSSESTPTREHNYQTTFNNRPYRSQYSEPALTVAENSQASFSQSVKNRIRGTYEYRCVICLTWHSGTQCAHVLDLATPGEHQVRYAVKLGVLPAGYQRNSAMNGIVLCPNCHVLFTNNHIVLSLPIPVLKYIQQYFTSTKVVRKPLYEVLDLLVDTLEGTEVGLPNYKAIIPYIGLVTLVTINPTGAARDVIATLHLPSLSIIRGTKFVAAPANTSATTRNAARIFDPLNIEMDGPRNPSMIPVSPDDEGFKDKRYWRLPVPAAAIFAALIARLPLDSSNCADIQLADSIHARLLGAKRYDMGDGAGGSGPSGGGGPSGGRGGGGKGGRGGGGKGGRGGGGRSGRGGGRGGVGRQSKRKGTSGESSASAEKGKKKARNVAGGDRAGDCGESKDPSEFPPRVCSQYGQSNRREIASSILSLSDNNMPARLIDTGKDNSDSETGRSISAIHPPDEDNPDEWRFGPSFSTNKIIFTASARTLM